jgi:hypothetical protein
VTIAPAPAEPTAFLIIGHPGHELRVHRWLGLARPYVIVLTDGSGGGGPRTHLTFQNVATAGARPGCVFAPWTDAECYRALLAKDGELFVGAGRAILEDARRLRPAMIVSDALEGYNPMHDVAWALASAVCAALEADGQPVEHLEFPVVAQTLAGPARIERGLDGPALSRKLAAAHAYGPLALEVDDYLASAGSNIALEQIFPAAAGPPADWTPYYEVVGRQRVEAGRYDTALEYGAHVRPVCDTIRQSLMRTSPRRIARAVAG